MYLGIDLGTSNSSVAGTIGDEFRIFKTAEGSDTLPSVIYVDKRGHKLFGKRAYDQTLLSPENVARKFKRLMGTSTPISIEGAGLTLTPEDCSSEILKQLVTQAFTESGAAEVTGAIVTIPAAFNQMQTEATLRAAQKAGLEKVGLLQEPIAAAMTAISQSKQKNGQFLVYDLGGGTFDLALVQTLSGNVSVIAHEGVNMLGGTDFDRLIMDNFVRPWLSDNFALPEGFQKDKKYQRVIKIAQLAAERAKIELSSKNQETIFSSDEEIRTVDEKGKEIFLEIPILRTDFENLIKPDLEQTIELSRKVLKDNGYSPGDIDRVVFIGGPTKMPSVRNLVPHELGIPADVKVDPMTAVALGAAIYAESREWGETTTKRKATRASLDSVENLDIKLDYPARTPDENAKIRLKVGEKLADTKYEYQIDSAQGWTSGRTALSADTVVEVPLTLSGVNVFRLTIFDEQGRPVKAGGSQFSVTRTRASSAGIPATQTISIKVRESITSTENVLQPLIKKGTILPAEGEQAFRVGRDLIGGTEESLDFSLFQDEGAREAHLNLCIGTFKIKGSDLEHGEKLREGDSIIFRWRIDDSGTLSAAVSVPSINKIFDAHNFYLDQAGHQSFDLESGTKLAESAVEEAKMELEQLSEALEGSAPPELQETEKEITKQEENLSDASDADATRAVADKARRIRQKISAIKHAPQNRARVIEARLSRTVKFFDNKCRKNADTSIRESFDIQARRANECIASGNPRALQDAERHLEEMGTLAHRVLWQDAEYLTAVFKQQVEKSYLATDKKEYDGTIQRGIEALKANNVDDLRRVIFKLMELQVNSTGTSENLTDLSSILRA